MGRLAVGSHVAADVGYVAAGKHIGLNGDVRRAWNAVCKPRRDKREGQQGNQSNPMDAVNNPSAHGI